MLFPTVIILFFKQIDHQAFLEIVVGSMSAHRCGAVTGATGRTAALVEVTAGKKNTKTQF